MIASPPALRIAKRLLLGFIIYALVSLSLVYDEGLRVERYQRMVKLSPEDIRAVGISLRPSSSVVMSQPTFERLLDAMAQRGENSFWQKGDKISLSWFWHREFTLERISDESLRTVGISAGGRIVRNREYGLVQIRSYPLIWLFLYKEVKS